VRIATEQVVAVAQEVRGIPVKMTAIKDYYKTAARAWPKTY
jgi:hypothetical protein